MVRAVSEQEYVRMHEIYHVDAEVERLRIEMGFSTLGPLWLDNLDDPFATCVFTHKDERGSHYRISLTEKGEKKLRGEP